jgi:hypothetical protein
MPDPSVHGLIEVVRGRLTGERAEQLVRFWTGHGALDEAAARERLTEVVCVLLDDADEIVGVNSVFPSGVDRVGGRTFWIYRNFLSPGVSDAAAAMIRAAFSALEAEFDASGDGPIGLCVLVAEPAEMQRRPEAEWADPAMIYAGYLADGRQVRIAYFRQARIAPGESRVMASWDLEGRYRAHLFPEQEAVDAQAVIDLWAREGVVGAEEAQRRVDEMLFIATDEAGDPVGISSVYLQHNEQLRMDLWYYRVFVAAAHRQSNIGVALSMMARDHLQDRFVTGQDQRAAGMIMEIENEGLKRAYNLALWLPTEFRFMGENERGDHVRVRYFPGALAPAPSG